MSLVTILFGDNYLADDTMTEKYIAEKFADDFPHHGSLVDLLQELKLLRRIVRGVRVRGNENDEKRAVAAANAFYRLGVLYDDGNAPFLERDPEKAIRYYQLANKTQSLCNRQVSGDNAQRLHIQALFRLGLLYFYGLAHKRDMEEDDSAPVPVEKYLEEAVMYLTRASEEGHANAKYYLGRILESSSDADSLVEAIRLYEVAAQRGHARAMHALGLIYQKGGSPKGVDIPRAINWFEQAASLEYVPAVCELGVLYCGGYHNPDPQSSSFSLQPDLPRALIYLQKAAESKCREALGLLGLLYFEGREGITQDPSLAISYFQQAAELGDPNAYKMLSMFCMHGLHRADGEPDFDQAAAYLDDGTRAFQEQELAMLRKFLLSPFSQTVTKEDAKKLIQTLQQASEDNPSDKKTAYVLGQIYCYGLHGTKIDRCTAIEFYKQAVGSIKDLNKDDTETAKDALFALGMIYYEGDAKESIPVDHHKALEYFRASSRFGHRYAMYVVADMLHRQCISSQASSDSEPCAMSEAILYYLMAAEQGHVGSMYQLGVLYSGQEPEVVAMDYSKAELYIEQAALLGDSRAMQLFADLLCSRNNRDAMIWIDDATEEGNLSAIFIMGGMYEYLEDQRHLICDRSLNGLQFWKIAMDYYAKSTPSVDNVEETTWFKLANVNDERKKWMQNWCQYRLGLLYHRYSGKLGDNNEQPTTSLLVSDGKEKARQIFEQANKDHFYMGYVGLAILADTEEDKIKYLLQAAEQGVAEAWTTLVPYVNHPYLLQIWAVENIAALQSIAAGQSSQDNEMGKEMELLLKFCTSTPQPEICSVCKHIVSKELIESVDKKAKILPSTHIDSSMLCLTSRQQSKRGRQGEVLFAALQIDEKGLSRSKQIALKRLFVTDGYFDEKYILLQQEMYYLQLMRGSPFIVQCLGHTSIVSDDSNRILYLVMEGAPYGTLHQLIAISNALSLPFIMRCMGEIAAGLAHMHQMFIHHGDVKPLNILIFDGLHLKLADFGMTKKIESKGVADSGRTQLHREQDMLGNTSFSDETTVSATSGTAWSVGASSCDSMSCNGGYGTIGYMSPDKRITKESDMFSFGMTCVHMINRATPSNAYRREMQEARKRLHERFTYGDELKKTEELVAMMEQCLNDDPSVRPSAKYCVELLTRLSNNGDDINEEIDSLIDNYRKLCI